PGRSIPRPPGSRAGALTAHPRGVPSGPPALRGLPRRPRRPRRGESEGGGRRYVRRVPVLVQIRRRQVLPDVVGGAGDRGGSLVAPVPRDGGGGCGRRRRRSRAATCAEDAPASAFGG